jgi:uncharacterized integral membrane protein (TIGR00697 family)
MAHRHSKDAQQQPTREASPDTVEGMRSRIAHLASHKPTRLLVILGGLFIANALVAEFIGVKIFALEESLGFEPWRYRLFGVDAAPQFTVGVLLWPIVFVMTDVINEYFGPKGVRLLTNMAVVLIAYAFVMVNAGIAVVPADWWVGSYAERGLDDAQIAYSVIYGQGIWIIAGSLVAFLVGQILDVLVFHRIKAWTGERAVWLRATGSTVVSQLVDSYIVIYVAFVLGPPSWSTELFVAVATNNYILKVGAAILLTPAIYGIHWVIDRYLGKAQAQALRLAAMEDG